MIKGVLCVIQSVLNTAFANNYPMINKCVIYFTIEFDILHICCSSDNCLQTLYLKQIASHIIAVLNTAFTNNYPMMYLWTPSDDKRGSYHQMIVLWWCHLYTETSPNILHIWRCFNVRMTTSPNNFPMICLCFICVHYFVQIEHRQIIGWLFW